MSPAARPVAHRFEWLAPVLVVDAVFTAFLLAQATVIFGRHAYLQRTTGLTYADYVQRVAESARIMPVWVGDGG
ncbi:MAG: DUF4173 domain-containing protein [Actinomycetota bacterium]|nr:DUF4173 domain-containing protein [Actinomycetota bacterium]